MILQYKEILRVTAVFSKVFSSSPSQKKNILESKAHFDAFRERKVRQADMGWDTSPFVIAGWDLSPRVGKIYGFTIIHPSIFTPKYVSTLQPRIYRFILSSEKRNFHFWPTKCNFCQEQQMAEQEAHALQAECVFRCSSIVVSSNVSCD